MSYPSPNVQSLIAEWFVPVRLLLNRAEDRIHFRHYRVIWTPTIAVLDRRGVDHYQSPGFLPPDQLLSTLRIGLARALTAWSRYDDAADQLRTVADDPTNGLAPEALFWLGVSWYLKSRSRTALMQAWQRLRDDYPTSVWALRVPPGQDAPEP